MAMSLAAAVIAIVAAFWINTERSSAIVARNTATTEAANAKTQEGKAKEQEGKAKAQHGDQEGWASVHFASSVPSARA